MVFQPVLSDADNNMVFGLESASITLVGASDLEEFIGVSDATVQALSAQGITVTGRP